MSAIAHLVSQTLAAHRPTHAVPISERGPEIARLRETGLTHREIADCMGLTLGTVQMTAARYRNEQQAQEAEMRLQTLIASYGQEIQNLRAAGIGIYDVAKMLQLTPYQVKKICTRMRGKSK